LRWNLPGNSQDGIMTKQQKAVCRIGTSGYQYNHWKGIFYPEDVRKQDWFAHYAMHFDTVEINNTFYNLPKADTFDQWRERARPDFDTL
jgi:uncharacterized protein YecE (DUF72 family)